MQAHVAQSLLWALTEAGAGGQASLKGMRL